MSQLKIGHESPLKAYLPLESSGIILIPMHVPKMGGSQTLNTV